MPSPYRAPPKAPTLPLSRSPLRRVLLFAALLLTFSLPWSRASSCSNHIASNYTGFELLARDRPSRLTENAILFGLLLLPVGIAFAKRRSRSIPLRAAAELVTVLLGAAAAFVLYNLAEFAGLYGGNELLFGGIAGVAIALGTPLGALIGFAREIRVGVDVHRANRMGTGSPLFPPRVEATLPRASVRIAEEETTREEVEEADPEIAPIETKRRRLD